MDAIRNAPESENVIVISELTTVEFCAAVARRRADKQLSDDAAAQMRFNFLFHAIDEIFGRSHQ